jgi:hypothetical protein
MANTMYATLTTYLIYASILILVTLTLWIQYSTALMSDGNKLHADENVLRSQQSRGNSSKWVTVIRYLFEVATRHASSAPVPVRCSHWNRWQTPVHKYESRCSAWIRTWTMSNLSVYYPQVCLRKGNDISVHVCTYISKTSNATICGKQEQHCYAILQTVKRRQPIPTLCGFIASGTMAGIYLTHEHFTDITMSFSR